MKAGPKASVDDSLLAVAAAVHRFGAVLRVLPPEAIARRFGGAGLRATIPRGASVLVRLSPFPVSDAVWFRPALHHCEVVM